MPATLKLQIQSVEIIKAVKGMTKREQEAFLEDILAATSPEYLKSIRESRTDYRKKRVKSHDEVLGR